MKSISLWRVFLSLLLTILSVIYIMPNFERGKNISWLPNSRINLGLDLQGGCHLLLDIDFNSYIKDQLEVLATSFRRELISGKIGYKNLHSDASTLSFSLRDEADFGKAKAILHKIDRGLDITKNAGVITVIFNEDRILDLKEKVANQSIEIVRLRVDPNGTTEPIIQRQGDNHILLQVPGADDPAYLKNVLGQTAKLTFHMVDEVISAEQVASGNIPPSSVLVKDSEGRAVVIKKKAALTGDTLIDAQTTFNQNSQPAVSFAFNNVGSKIFADITRQNSGKRFAIVLDNKLLSAPVINEPITGGSGIISGSFTVESANELALLLRAGALPAPLTIIEERSIGPNLGVDSIEAGKKAGLIGFIGVVVFMTWSYGVMGVFANLALSIALLYIFAMLSMFHATLTLPGIAGIILTIGMAVDANVLIYERIREEILKGSSNLYAVRQGFESAFATITDSNITTLIAAFLLYFFGVGAIKGFAVTLSIGIIASMFAATVITKLFVDSWMKYYKPRTLGLE